MERRIVLAKPVEIVLHRRAPFERQRRNHAPEPGIALRPLGDPGRLVEILALGHIHLDEDELIDAHRIGGLGQMFGQHQTVELRRVFHPWVTQPLRVERCTWLSTIGKSSMAVLLTPGVLRVITQPITNLPR